ncbi:hypothetical protein ACO0K9_03465 [Undibacterium sp. Ji50W]|uniref:hypothetical protein n=1 Tax=Undibacterium sp. Ji50W TaxID=3413041 RepID=UPI003BF10D30
MGKNITEIDKVAMDYQRMAYFAGQFLEAEDLITEQEYHLMRRRKLNKELYSHGVRKGFSVTVGDLSKKKITVSRGLAIDINGCELWLETDKELTLPEGLDDGPYLLCICIQEEGTKNTEFVDQNKLSWIGDTRQMESVNFSIVSAETDVKLDPKYIKLAQFSVNKNALIKDIDNSKRHVSISQTGLALNIQSGEHYVDMYYQGELNAYIGFNGTLKSGLAQSPDCVTFDSMSKRMHLYGEEELYIANIKGVVVGKAWGGNGDLTVEGRCKISNRLDVDGPARLAGKLEVASDVEIKDGLEVHGEITSHANDFKLGANREKKGHLGRALVAGASDLVLNYDGDWDKVVIASGVEIKGGLEVHGEITSHANDFKLGANREKRGHRGRALVAGASDLVLNYDSDWDKVVIASGAEIRGDLTSLGSDFKLGSMRPRKRAEESRTPGRALVAYDYSLWINHQADWDKTIIGSEMEVLGLVFNSPGRTYSNNMDAAKKEGLLQKLQKNGDFVFFVENANGKDNGELGVYWRANNEIKRSWITQKERKDVEGYL